MLTLPLTLGVGIPLKARNTLSESEFFSSVFVAAQCEYYLDLCVMNSVNGGGGVCPGSVCLPHPIPRGQNNRHM